MFRTTIVLLAVMTSFCSVVADDNKGDRSKVDKGIIATFVMADVTKNTITYKTTDKAGKTIEMRLALDKNAKIFGSNDKLKSLADFVKSMESRHDKSIIVIEDKERQHILEIKDIPKKI